MPRVLVVEDERRILRSLEQGLRAEGYDDATAATGEEGYRSRWASLRPGWSAGPCLARARGRNRRPS